MKQMLLKYGALAIALIAIAILAIFMLRGTQQPTDYAKIIGQATGELAKESNGPSYEETYPTLREIDFGSDFDGNASPLDGKWSRYTNGTLGFSIEYFSPRSPREMVVKNTHGDRSYTVYLSQMDEYLISVWIRPARFHTIDDWRKAQPDYQAPNHVFMHRMIDGYDAVTTWYVSEFPPITDARIERNTYLIKDDIMYQITTRDLESEAYERIINSFRFLED